MRGKVAIITGAGRGIGEAIAIEFAKRGAKVMLGARSADEIRKTARVIRKAGGEAEAIPCDVTSTSDIVKLLSGCQEAFGHIDILVNNAGTGQFLALDKTTDEDWDTMLDTNLKGAFVCCREVIPHFTRNGGGHIINVASIAAVRGFPQCSAYCASKAGLLGLSRALREELRSAKIRISVILPGPTDSSYWDNVAGEWDRTKMIKCADVATVVVTIAGQPPEVTTEEVILMPSGGAL